MKKRISALNIEFDQKILFLISGAFQYLLDVAIFSILILFLADSLLANIISKFTVGLSGFFVNGLLVFKTIRKMSKFQVFISFFKFLFLLSFMTTLSNYLISVYDGENYFFKVITKIISEVFLAVLSFSIQKFFVYRTKNEEIHRH